MCNIDNNCQTGLLIKPQTYLPAFPAAAVPHAVLIWPAFQQPKAPF